MATYQLLVSETSAYYVDIDADNEDAAIDKYYEDGGDEYGHKTIEVYVVEGNTIDND